VTGSVELRTWLYNRARTFVYSTAPSPGLAAACSERITQVQHAESERERLMAVSRELRQGLMECGLQITPPAGPEGPIVPVVLGSAARAMEAADVLTERGILVQAIRPPTVPEGAARLRLTAKANFSELDLDRLTSEVARACAP